MTTVVALPDRLDISSCQALLPRLLELRAEDVEADGSSVRHIGAVGAQFLISAKSSWLKDSSKFEITGLSEQALKCLTALGIDPAQIGARTEGAS